MAIDIRAPIFAPIFKAVALAAAIISQPVPNLLAGTLQPAAPAAAPFFQTDWPNPTERVREFVVDPQTRNLALFTPVVGAAPFRQTDWPTPFSKPESLEAHGYANRLPPEEAAAPGVPFAQLDWQNPLQRAQHVAAQTAQPTTNIVVNAVVVQPKPFAQYDWPTPITRFFSPDDPVARNLALLATPFSQTDWQNPARRAELQAFDPPNLLTTTLTPVAQATPFAQTDWPNPLTKARDLAVDGYNTNRVLPDESEELHRSGAYFAGQFQKDRQFEAIFAQPVANLAINLTPAAAAPFAPTDLANPESAREFVDSPVAPNIVISTPSAVAVPFSPALDWPNPALRQPTTQEFQPPNLLATTLAEEGGTPFQQADWPNPPIAPQQIEAILSQPVSNIVIRTPSAFSVPFSMVDWPNPVITIPLDISNLGMTGSTHLSFIPPPPEPPAGDAYRKIISLREDMLSVVKG